RLDGHARAHARRPRGRVGRAAAQRRLVQPDRPHARGRVIHTFGGSMAHAELVFTGGPVFTADTVRSRASAVAVRGGRIGAVGHGVGDLVGPKTEVVELTGRMLVPGCQDAHVHPVWGGLDLLRCDLSESRGQDATLATIRAYAAAHPDREWILGGG